jgi:type II secretory pathway component PulC
MRRIGFMTTMCGLLLAGTASAQTREEKVRNDKKKVEAAGFWIYNDLPKGFEEAKKTGKPMVVVLRCLPCEECVKLDDELIDADQQIKPLIEQFVRVRVVGTNGLDLKTFQFDTDQSFAVFFLNADGTIYGRFGTRSHRTNWVGDVSVDGLAKALQGALALHKNFSNTKSELQAKRGPVPTFERPELLPTLKEKYKSTLNYEGNVVQSCIHCHQIGDAQREAILSKGEQLPETLLFPYPHPTRTLGLKLDPKERAKVLSVEAGSISEKAGLKTGDEILKLAGQPLLSIADVQWVLHNTSGLGTDLTAEVLRDGKALNLKVSLPKGWRERDDISWRASTWGLRRVALGGMLLVDLPEEQRTALKLPADSTALRVEHVGQFAPHNIAQQAGVKKGDILVSFDGNSKFTRETDIIASALRNRKPGAKVPVEVIRDGKRQTLTLSFR